VAEISSGYRTQEIDSLSSLEDGNRSSFRNVVYASLLEFWVWTKSSNSIILSGINHRNPPLILTTVFNLSTTREDYLVLLDPKELFYIFVTHNSSSTRLFLRSISVPVQWASCGEGQMKSASERGSRRLSKSRWHKGSPGQGGRRSSLALKHKLLQSHHSESYHMGVQNLLLQILLIHRILQAYLQSLFLET
jgi:hypothetical protein